MGARLVAAAATAVIALPLALAAGCGSSDDTANTANTGNTGTDPAATRSPSAMSSGTASSSAASSSSSAAPAGWPSCVEVWKSGARLSAHYKGCSADGSAVPAQRVGCESGQFFVVYADHYWAVGGGTIHHADHKLANSPAYTAAIAICRG